MIQNISSKKVNDKALAIEEIEWLNTHPPLEALLNRYPKIWEEAAKVLMAAAKTQKTQTLNELAIKSKHTAELWKERMMKSNCNTKVVQSALPNIIKSRMLVLALEQGYLAAAAGKTTGKVRFNLVNGYIIQKLLFSHDLVCKPASLRLFKFWWRFITQKKLLMPLVQDKGIYCFYSKELIAELRGLIDNRSCLEIAAGNGTLSRFLSKKGVKITATDDLSWGYAIKYDEHVENLDAKTALTKYQPRAVICSWPPPGNNFERHVFNTKTVELYIVIGSRHRFISGNWEDYENQNNFDWVIDTHLSSLVIPPEGNSAVLIFRRKSLLPKASH